MSVLKTICIICITGMLIFAMSVLGLVACLWWFTSSSVQPQPAPSSSPPHIIIILADDLGWNDVSFHGSDQFQTPNIDALAYSGVILQDYYTQPICTPSRAALLTGRHPISNGMEHDVIYAPQPWGLPLTERILPEYLKPLGYTSRMIGKWHLGFFQSNYTPARRGFDTHYGIWLGHQDHISHMGYEAHPGYDFHRELSVTWDAVGQYSANLFIEEAENIIREHDSSRPLFLYLAHTAPHAPLQAPSNIVQRFSYIPNKKRQTYAAMVTMLDESVGQVMAALKTKNMLNNTIILFLSDNGGATNGFNGNVASNWPFRGGKDTLWEGGVRAAGLIWSPLLGNTPRVHRGLVNVQDWLPTLLEAAGAPVDKNVTRVDGVSQWKALQQKSDPPYTTMLHNIDPQRNIAALRHDHWKVVIGRTYNGAYDGFYGKLSGKVPYNLDRVRISEAGKAVMSSPSPLPLDTEMLQMRVDATVSCTNPMPTTLAPTPHVIQVREATFTMDDPRIEATQTKDKDTILKQKKRVGDATTSKITTDKTTNAPTTVAPGICQPHLSPCLFNLRDDPCETHNLASEFPEILQQLMAILQGYHPVPPNNKPSDPRSFPEHWNNTWTTWQDFL